MPEQRVLLTYQEAAEVTGLSPGYIKELCDTGVLPYVLRDYYRVVQGKFAHRIRARRIFYVDLVRFILSRRRCLPRRPPRVRHALTS